jgi:hypothetical protein
MSRSWKCRRDLDRASPLALSSVPQEKRRRAGAVQDAAATKSAPSGSWTVSGFEWNSGLSIRNFFMATLAATLSWAGMNEYGPASRAGEVVSMTNSNLPSRDFNLPGHFSGILSDRAIIDFYQAKNYKVSAGATPSPATSITLRNPAGHSIRVVQAALSTQAIQNRALMSKRLIPARGFRAPILENADESPTSPEGAAPRSERERQAADCVAKRLAYDGLLPTLAQVVTILGPEAFHTNVIAGIESLKLVGFPVDLLMHFELAGHAGTRPKGSKALVNYIADELFRGRTAASLNGEFSSASFGFVRADGRFEVAMESGEDELGLLRLQAGGGYDDGIVPGGSIDVISQLISALPGLDFLISVPNDMLTPFHKMGSIGWRLRRSNQVTLIGESSPVAPWAQDNGKAGFLAGQQLHEKQLATLAPRYASIDEGCSTFVPGESFLMDGLRAAGHAVVHSSLLFQGGNMLAVRDPKSGDRILLLGEGELFRNIALGFTREQAVEAFKTEFKVNRCLVLPAVSYHLDFDLCVRAHGGELIAFVNDTMAAVHLIIDLGITALERHGSLDRASTQLARSELAEHRSADLVRRLGRTMQAFVAAGTNFPLSLSKCFVAGKTDSGAGNLQTFLLAIDLLESSLVDAERKDTSSERKEYLRALRNMEAARRKQTEVLKEAGWTVAAVPSLTDLASSINYLNGVHHRGGYIMPAFGGFYAPLDQAAITRFKEKLGAEFKIISIQSAECQRAFGGVHCISAAYPRL